MDFSMYIKFLDVGTFGDIAPIDIFRAEMIIYLSSMNMAQLKRVVKSADVPNYIREYCVMSPMSFWYGAEIENLVSKIATQNADQIAHIINDSQCMSPLDWDEFKNEARIQELSRDSSYRELFEQIKQKLIEWRRVN
jgi:hypothetical protein